MSDFVGNSVSTFDSNTGAFIKTLVASGSGGLDGASGIRVGPDGNLYVTSQNTNTVARFNSQTGAALGDFVSAGLGGLSSPQDLLFAPDGSLLVVSSANDEILRYSGQTGAFLNVFSTLDPPTQDGPINLIYGPNGDLYVTAFDGSRILELQGATGALDGTFAPPSGTTPAFVGIAFAPDGTLLASAIDPNTGAGSVLAYDTTSRALIGTRVPFGSGGLTTPAALYVDSAGRLDVLDPGTESMNRYDAVTGTFIDTLIPSGSGGLIAPLFFTVSNAPEPGTITLMGFGLLAAAALRISRSRPTV